MRTRIFFRILLTLMVVLGSCYILFPEKDELYARKRQLMVRQQLAARDITDKRVLEAMETVPRHLFVSPEYRDEAYNDHPLPIGEGQTISQPYTVALMTHHRGLKSGEKV